MDRTGGILLILGGLAALWLYDNGYISHAINGVSSVTSTVGTVVNETNQSGAMGGLAGAGQAAANQQPVTGANAGAIGAQSPYAQSTVLGKTASPLAPYTPTAAMPQGPFIPIPGVVYIPKVSKAYDPNHALSGLLN